MQDTAAETPNADAGFRPYSEHGRVLSEPDALFHSATFAPAVGGLPHDEETGAYRAFLGVWGREPMILEESWRRKRIGLT